VGYHTVAAFSELNYHSRWGNITAGWRFEQHSAVDPAFVPRLAYTKAWDRWHLKALYTYAFRTPGIQNINLAVDAPIRPELSRVAEAEIGYRVPGLVSITANAFRIDVSDPIVYLFNETDESYTYVNRGRTGSIGGELVAKAAGRWGSATVQWSHYLGNNNSIEEFMKEGDSKAMLGMPRNVFGFRGIFHLPNEWALSTQAFWSEARSTYLPFDEDYEDLREVAYPAYWLLDLNVQRTFLWNGQLDVALGVHNLLDEVAYIVAPSNSGLLPLPMHRREIVLSVRYTLH
jgi:outer membrane receptor for ferrienterochelin and colicin